MKTNTKLAITLAATTAIALGITIYIRRKSQQEEMLNKIANEGYETAGDIHFPLKGRRLKRFFN